MSYDFAGLDSRLLGNARETLYAWFPNGKVQGHEFCIGSLNGEDGSSLKVNLRTGVWKDWATDQGGKGLVALYSASRQIEQGAAYKELGGAGVEPVTSTKPKTKPAPTVTAEADDDEPPFEFAKQSDYDRSITDGGFIHHKFGTGDPTPYHVRIGDEWKIATVCVRFEYGDGKKTFLPYIWSKYGWKSKMPPEPRPLYGLKRVAEYPSKDILVVEGEKCARAAEKLFPTAPIACWMGGASNVMMNDWEPLRGRKVTLWPDADEPGWRCMQRLGAYLITLGCKVKWIDTATCTTGYDIADAAKDHNDDGKKVGAWMATKLGEFVPEDLTESRLKITRNKKAVVADIDKEQDAHGVFHVEHAQARWNRWGLQCNARGPYANEANVGICLERIVAEGLQQLPWYDRFKNKMLWRRTEDGPIEEWNEVNDHDLLMWLQSTIGIQSMRFGIIERCMAHWAKTHSRDCWMEQLHALNWDKKPRLEQLFSRGMGAEDTLYTRAVSRCFLMGMAARGVDPGCQLDYAVVLEGPQGNLKSSACRALGEPYFAEVHTEIGTVRWQEVIQGLALAEFAEMQSWSAARNETIKASISNRTDKYRAAYARESADHPRRVVFIATTNNNRWVTDESGARRFWPIKTTTIDLDWIKANRDQMLAEAVFYVLKGESYHLDKIEEKAAKTEQRKRQVGDAWDDNIANWLYARRQATTSDVAVLALGFEVKNIDYQSARRINVILRRFGWTEGDNGQWIPGDELKDLREEEPDVARVS